MASPTVGLLLEALKNEFEDEVVFLPHFPTVVSTPGVYVAPGDPYLEPGTHGGIREHWGILVAVSVREPGPGIDLLRELALRIARVATTNGAVWRRATGLRRPLNPDNAQLVMTICEVDFVYPNPE